MSGVEQGPARDDGGSHGCNDGRNALSAEAPTKILKPVRPPEFEPGTGFGPMGSGSFGPTGQAPTAEPEQETAVPADGGGKPAAAPEPRTYAVRKPPMGPIRPTYLIEPDSEELFVTGETTAPPVIGEGRGR